LVAAKRIDRGKAEGQPRRAELDGFEQVAEKMVVQVDSAKADRNDHQTGGKEH
jgi:hypothetical protein